jgi:hypothetical protein
MLDVAMMPANYLPVIAICPILIWAVLVIFFSSICFALQDAIIRLKRLHQIPCSGCIFFTGDYRLKCTVHPCKALSEEAIDCLDYEPKPAATIPVWVHSTHFYKKGCSHSRTF